MIISIRKVKNMIEKVLQNFGKMLQDLQIINVSESF